MSTTKSSYRRVIVKFSGEALLGQQQYGIDTKVIANIAQELKPVVAARVQVGLIIGGGNFYRGAQLQQDGITRVTGDYLGMLATMMNALAMRDIFTHLNIPTKVVSALPLAGVLEQYVKEQVDEYLAQNFVVIFAGGTGNPLVTTDTALSLRGIELGADLLLKATNVDGVYAVDPHIDPEAKLYRRLSYQEVLEKELAVMDLFAFCLCRDHKMKLRIFNMHITGALMRIINGENEGTIVE